MQKLLILMAVCFTLGCLRMYCVITSIDRAASEPIRFKPPPPPPEPTPEEKALARVTEEIRQAIANDEKVDIQKVNRLPKSRQALYWTMFFEQRVHGGLASYFWHYGDQYNKPILEALKTVKAGGCVDIMNFVFQSFEENRKRFESLRQRGNAACYARWLEDSDLGKYDRMLDVNEKMEDMRLQYVREHPELFGLTQAAK